MKALKHGNSSDNKNIKPVPFGRWLSYGVGASLFVHGLLVIGFIFINTTQPRDPLSEPKPYIIEVIVEMETPERTPEPMRDPEPLPSIKPVPKTVVQTKPNLTMKTQTPIEELMQNLALKPRPTPKDIPLPPQLQAGKFVRERQKNGGGSITFNQANKNKAEKQNSQKQENELKNDDASPVDDEAPGAKQAPVKKEEPALDLGNEQKKGDGDGLGTGLDDQDKRELTQTERDIVLAQIIKYWRFNLTSPEAKELTLNGSVVVLPSGMLAPPFNGTDPWNPRKSMPQYDQALKSGNTFLSNLMISFYTALRLSQPLDLPASTKGTWPKKISISFRFKDLPNRPYLAPFTKP